MTSNAAGRCLGLIGGLGVGATIHYYRALVAAHEKHGIAPRLLICHADLVRVLGDVRENNLPGLAQYLGGLIQALRVAGADLAAVAAVTPHICMPRLVGISPLPMVDLVEEVVREIRMKSLRRVALFGTRFTVETKLFGRLGDIDVVPLTPDELDYVHSTYVQVVQAGRGSVENFNGLRHVAHALCGRGAQAIVMAGTELSLVFNEANTDFPAIDCARLHVAAIMRSLVD